MVENWQNLAEAEIGRGLVASFHLEDLAEELEQRAVGLQRLRLAQLRAEGLRRAPVATVGHLLQEQATVSKAENKKKYFETNRNRVNFIDLPKVWHKNCVNVEV